MSDLYRLTLEHLFEVLEEWDAALSRRVLVVACGGTALTLYGYKDSTKDVDFLVPVDSQFKTLLSTLQKLRYQRGTGFAYKHPNNPWLFDLYGGQTVFQTSLLDPIHLPENHRLIREFKRLRLACLTPPDLIISKMFRGTMTDVDDSLIMLKAEKLDMARFTERFIETAGYYYNPLSCKKNLHYLILEMEAHRLDTSCMREMSEKWNP